MSETNSPERLREFGLMLIRIEKLLRDAPDLRAEVDFVLAAWVENFGAESARDFKRRLDRIADRIVVERTGPAKQ